MALRHEELTKEIRACIFEVHNDIGVGLNEETYHQALLACFSKRGFPTVSKERKYLVHRGARLKRFELDFLVFEKIIVALKAVPIDFVQAHYAQIISELKLWQKDLGLLVNFGRPRAEIERIPFNEKEKRIGEDYSEIKRRVGEATRRLLARIREAILFVFEAHGLGYGKVACQNLLQAELDYQKITYNNNFHVPVKYGGQAIGLYKTKAFNIEDQLLCTVTAIQNQISLLDVTRMRTYLKHSGFVAGLLINFGKSCLEIKAILR